MSTILFEANHVCQTFTSASGGKLVVLDDVNLSLREGEIVGLLGRSGSGKSTLLRIVAGLVPPTAGTVAYHGQPVTGPVEGIAMVFQTFALFPWLTVLQNVELGLEALGVPAKEMRQRALSAIDLIGLDGFESAYPRELSGGMRQRVGFARGLVVRPNILLMDEPFSALDVLTAETLRTDLLELWIDGKMPTKSILLVTHNIEEAVLLCDRILLFSSNPGRVATEIRVELGHPRDRLDPAFRRLVDDIYSRMTAKGVAPGREPARGPHGTHGVGIDMALPRVSSNVLAGLLESVAAAPYDGKADLPAVAAALQLEVDDLFHIAETLQLLRFADLEAGDIILTAAGRHFVESAVDARKRLFAEHLLAYVPLAAHIKRVLDERPQHRAPQSRFVQELEDHMTDGRAEQTMRAIVSWGRYAEIFAYDEQAAEFSLENPT